MAADVPSMRIVIDCAPNPFLNLRSGVSIPAKTPLRFADANGGTAYAKYGENLVVEPIMLAPIWAICGTPAIDATLFKAAPVIN